MVSVKIDFGKEDFIWIGLLIVLIGAGFVFAYNSGATPDVMGHDADELEGVGGVVETGVLNHGDIIPIPNGYDAEDCKWMVSLENIQGVGTVNSDDTLGVWVGVDRKVHVGDWDASANYKTVEPGDTTGDVNYMIICGGAPAVGGEGFNPTSYSGGESVTFPNGMIMKSGNVAYTSIGTKTITFGTPFPNGVISVVAQFTHDTHTHSDEGHMVLNSESINGFQFVFWDVPSDINWQAWGY